MPHDLNLFAIFWEAGWVVKLVMLFLFGLSIFSWSIFIKKYRQINEMKRNEKNFQGIYNKSSNFNQVLKDSEKIGACPSKTMFLGGHTELLKISQSFDEANLKEELNRFLDGQGMEFLNRALEKGQNDVRKKYQDSLGILASIGSLSPFIGLFGTVWGIIQSFQGLSGGSASLETVAPGLAEALVATALGLLVAIPSVAFYNFLNSKYELFELDMDSFSRDFLNMVQRTFLV